MTTEHDLIRALSLNAGDLADPLVVRWKDLDPDATTEELERLRNWVDWLHTRYRLDHKVFPPCWSEHGSLVEELSALRTLWEACYLDDASPSDPITFHRDLEPAMRRLREWTSRLGCTRTAHRPEPDPDPDLASD
ncbi:hypothetical protein EV643_13912 [Kribbella sp. VKM Ac-2527]|uniref:Uncharacterized protein n=1 Tax=Kribbella caucasensis TaxID=2512215 RepID=A0A4R6J4B1_9ACTN|nr:hypothetical protein [Kribbella sp. VKM Ac-2527]TDO30213.1 hypothetical protein EV643_13912 [Kribbella sp. VKM Ac-2527]